MHKKGIYEKLLKRPFDFLISSIALLILSPLLLIVSILVKIKLGSPVIFKQKRPGKNEKIFTLYKFRTMIEKRDQNGVLLPDSDRLTKFGRFLRKTSIDELPELFNIVKGDMSIIGPRPLAIEYLPYYEKNERVRHLVKPGLSGLAQVKGRNTMAWEERFNYDLEYIKNITFIGDIKIIIKTIYKTIKRSDVGERGIDVPEDFHVYRSKRRR